MIKEVEFLTTLQHKYFIKSFYSFFDQENVQIKYQLPSNKISYEKENRYVFCFLMEYAEKGDLS